MQSAGRRPHDVNCRLVGGGSAGDDPVTVVMLGVGYDLDRVRSEHLDDGTGPCRACGGLPSGRYAWPCATALAAERALRLRHQRSRAADPALDGALPVTAGPVSDNGVGESSCATA